MHICAHVLLQVYACMRRMPIQGKQGDHVMYKITRANSMEKYTKSKQGRRWCPRFVRAAIPTHARTYHATQGFTSRVPCIDHGVFTRSPPLLGHDDHADSTIPATSTTVCSATATPQTRLCQLLRQLSARLRRPLRLLQLDHADYFNSRLLGCGDYFDSATNQAKSYFNKYLSIKYSLMSVTIANQIVKVPDCLDGPPIAKAIRLHPMSALGA
jgi:hypothetical protein